MTKGKNHTTELRGHIGLLEAVGYKVLKITARCPVDIEVESPSGLIQSKTQSQMPGATYTEADADGNGDLDRFIEIPFPEQGDHKWSCLSISLEFRLKQQPRHYIDI